MNAPEPNATLAQILQLSNQIAQLYTLLEKNSQIRTRILQDTETHSGLSDYEALRLQLEATLPNREYLGQEIARRVSQIADLQRARDGQRDAASADSHPRTTPADVILAQDVEQETRMGQELLDLASAQIEAVKRWNENPDPARLTDFQAEYSQLWERYRVVLAKLQDIRARHGDENSASQTGPNQ